MKLQAVGLDASAPISLRERAALSGQRLAQLLSVLPEGVCGLVPVQTCGRCELYLEAEDGFDAPAFFCQAAGLPEVPEELRLLEEEKAALHLHRVAAGLESAVFGDEQISGQLTRSAEAARKAGTLSPALAALFRSAVTAGRLCRQVLPAGIPRSAAAAAVRFASDRLGGLAGKKALVIGSGEMGRLAARGLLDRGAQVTVTLRTARQGDSVVPFGCGVIPYDRRLEALPEADLVVSATRSPHRTLTAGQCAGLNRLPEVLIDLALPRDIDPALGGRTTLADLDTLGAAAPTACPEAEEIIARQLRELDGWRRYRASMGGMADLGQAILDRVLTDLPPEPEEAAVRAVDTAVRLLLAEFREELSPERLEACTDRIRRRTRPAGREEKRND